MRTFGNLGIVGIAISCLTLAFVPTAANADTGPGDDIDVLDELARVTSESDSLLSQVLDGVAAVPAGDGRNALDGFVNGVAIEVPASASEPITVSSSLGRTVSIGLPFATTSEVAEVAADGVAVFENEQPFSTSTIIKDDGSVQVATVITDTTAPTRYAYPLALPEDVTLTLDDGYVIATDAAGSYYASVAPAWAVDANGASVRTHYEIGGHVLTQVIEHSAKTAFPVVADPWFGIDIWLSVTVNRNGPYLGQPVYSAVMTNHGAFIYHGIPTIGFPGGIPAGSLIIRTAGWDEWVTKSPGVASKASLRQQFDCHVSYGYGFFGSGFHWDLEKARANYANWNSNPSVHRCNW